MNDTIILYTVSSMYPTDLLTRLVHVPFPLQLLHNAPFGNPIILLAVGLLSYAILYMVSKVDDFVKDPWNYRLGPTIAYASFLVVIAMCWKIAMIGKPFVLAVREPMRWGFAAKNIIVVVGLSLLFLPKGELSFSN
eukprot:GHVQ01039341.1.p1 GENE.GHVQ01039341.1~~GHVQ01039341.1.p1  ORF type:complete len:136 (+),score=9.14 GHVQ01039341.1:116-523(+)